MVKGMMMRYDVTSRRRHKDRYGIYRVVVSVVRTLTSFWFIYSFLTRTPGSEGVCNSQQPRFKLTSASSETFRQNIEYEIRGLRFATPHCCNAGC